MTHSRPCFEDLCYSAELQQAANLDELMIAGMLRAGGPCLLWRGLAQEPYWKQASQCTQMARKVSRRSSCPWKRLISDTMGTRPRLCTALTTQQSAAGPPVTERMASANMLAE